MEAGRIVSLFDFKIGQTPLIKVIEDDHGGGIYAKAEWHNLTGTIKDRVALAMIRGALQRFSSLTEAREKLHLLEYSGGSLAFSLATICRSLNIKLSLVVGDWLSKSDLSKLNDGCQELFVTPKEMGFYQVILEAKKLAAANPNYCFLNQHENEACVEAHEGTANEILSQSTGVTFNSWVASVGTGATVVGVGKILKNYFPNIRICGVTPSEQPYATPEPPNGRPKFVGSGGLGNGLLQPLVERAKPQAPIDEHFDVSFDEACLAMIRLYEKHGLLVGSSAAANYIIAYEEYLASSPGGNVLTVFPSACTVEQVKGLRTKSRSASGRFAFLN